MFLVVPVLSNGHRVALIVQSPTTSVALAIVVNNQEWNAHVLEQSLQIVCPRLLKLLLRSTGLTLRTHLATFTAHTFRTHNLRTVQVLAQK